MPKAISNTSPLLYLHRIGALEWLPQLFDEFWTPSAVVAELQEGRRCGFDVPDPTLLPWLQIVEPRSIPAEWLALDLGHGELAAMAMARENPDRIVLLDDALARRTAPSCGASGLGYAENHAGGKSPRDNANNQAMGRTSRQSRPMVL